MENIKGRDKERMLLFTRFSFRERKENHMFNSPTITPPQRQYLACPSLLRTVPKGKDGRRGIGTGALATKYTLGCTLYGGMERESEDKEKERARKGGEGRKGAASPRRRGHLSASPATGPPISDTQNVTPLVPVS